MRGIVNGEIRDRTHLFNIILFVFILFLTTIIPFFSSFEMLTNAPSNRWYHNSGEDLRLRGTIVLAVGIVILYFVLLGIAKEFIFMTINKNQITIKRPLLSILPFHKQKSRIELQIKDIREIIFKIGYKKGRPWLFIDKNGKEILKINFAPEFIFQTVDLKDFFEKNEIQIKLTTVFADR